ncbi:uncharacterized protein RAG0_10801 [Rhynchosporium agropyri]|uniref:Uncharacterized protein n=1 Tax=Rhynchosporium agropyri TaxID=914238 RepID=A0A1E1L1C1_9HELO|nr:uncharacterized protein RAG0_10801 [Rhynchosporium agropyri]
MRLTIRKITESEVTDLSTTPRLPMLSVIPATCFMHRNSQLKYDL